MVMVRVRVRVRVKVKGRAFFAVQQGGLGLRVSVMVKGTGKG
jgi:hypothetical protein